MAGCNDGGDLDEAGVRDGHADHRGASSLKVKIVRFFKSKHEFALCQKVNLHINICQKSVAAEKCRLAPCRTYETSSAWPHRGEPSAKLSFGLHRNWLMLPSPRCMAHFTPLREDMSSRGTHHQGQFAISILIDCPNGKAIVRRHMCLHFGLEKVESISVNSRAQLRVTLCRQLATPGAQSRPWPPWGKMLNIRRGQTLTCRTTAKNLYIVTALALRVRQPLPFFSSANSNRCTFRGFYIPLQGGVKGQGRFQVPCDGRRWKTQLHRGIFTTSNQV